MYEPAIIIARTINEYLTVIFDKAGNIIDSIWYPEKKMGNYIYLNACLSRFHFVEWTLGVELADSRYSDLRFVCYKGSDAILYEYATNTFVTVSKSKLAHTKRVQIGASYVAKLTLGDDKKVRTVNLADTEQNFKRYVEFTRDINTKSRLLFASDYDISNLFGNIRFDSLAVTDKRQAYADCMIRHIKYLSPHITLIKEILVWKFCSLGFVIRLSEKFVNMIEGQAGRNYPINVTDLNNFYSDWESFEKIKAFVAEIKL